LNECGSRALTKGGKTKLVGPHGTQKMDLLSGGKEEFKKMENITKRGSKAGGEKEGI